LGEAVVTGAGALKARYVVHAAGMRPGLSATEDSIRNATRNSLLRAEELRIESVAFPAIGTGVGGLPAERAAKVMVSVVREHLSKPTSLRTVVFALYDRNVYNIFGEEMRRELGTNPSRDQG